ncbi:MAG: septum formation protein [Arcticibacterium sp.]|jgi:septum formation protein
MLTLSYPLILGSGSPRRQEIMQNAGFSFSVVVKPTDEAFPEDMLAEEIPVFLAKQKLSEFGEEFRDKIVICADTVVIVNGQVLNKPSDEREAKEMLQNLSGNKHTVVTGVAYRLGLEVFSFSDTCLVDFNKLTDAEITYYIKTCQPMDKAGAYGIQDFIGMVGVRSLEGSFYTVMGLPIHKVYEHLKSFISF